MLRFILLASVLGLAACVAPESSGPIVEMPALSATLACNAGNVRTCPAGGCTAANPGEQSTLYVSLEVPARGGAGRFCIATGCEDATYTPRVSNAPFAWTMRTNDRTNYTADLQISGDQRSFTLSEGAPGVTNTWTGTCSPAGS